VNAPSLSSRPEVAARQFQLLPEDNSRLTNLLGPFNNHLRQVERGFGVEINQRGFEFEIVGGRFATEQAEGVLRDLFTEAEHEPLSPQRIHLAVQSRLAGGPSLQGLAPGLTNDESEPECQIRTPKGWIRARGSSQVRYLEAIRQQDLVFGVGPAGTGKTYLAVAAAVEALEADQVRRIVLVRPAVEAGEKLGFLPGDLAQKIDPYLRPMYDALYEMLGFERVGRMIERHVIEVAPLAFMRGRTLNEAFIILDEAQNTTPEQMKMFLTRIGFGSRAVVTGDITQIDLPPRVQSGLRQALKLLIGVEGVAQCLFQNRDVVRHPLVKRIVAAYDAFDARETGPVA